MSDKPKGPYTVWKDNGYDGWSFEDYATLDEAVFTEKYTMNWVIQEPVQVRVTHVKLDPPSPTPTENTSPGMRETPENAKDG